MSALLMAGRALLFTDSLTFTAPGLDIGYLSSAVVEARTAAFQ